MSDPTDTEAELKIGAHVLVQLGRELVTDVEQAILECVKNAYDADSPGCTIIVETSENGVSEEVGPASRYLRFNEPSETVSVELFDQNGNVIGEDFPDTLAGTSTVTRRLRYTGQITIEDKGDGIEPEKLQESWLVVSRSEKRGEAGKRKEKTKKGRVPLGDKGLGRLGSMKLGDILRIETATSPSSSIAVAQFRWTDCETAKTVDEIPVFMTEMENKEKFKGTRIKILGLKEINEWKRKSRATEISNRLARLISPFEATSTFPVAIRLDGDDQSLVSVTEEALKQAVATFEFSWKEDEGNPKNNALIAKAKFRKRLFQPTRNQGAIDMARAIFGNDKGQGFSQHLKNERKFKGYKETKLSVDGEWFIELTRLYYWHDILGDTGEAVHDPGKFSGAFYFYHLDKLGDGEKESPSAVGKSVTGLAVTSDFIKSIRGIAILRDGFSVRTPGDWLGISEAMTYTGTYGLRYDNTVGYFALTGEHNFSLTEKSDREGFVEDAAFRGFMQIAKQCRNFANDSMIQVRESYNAYAKLIEKPADGSLPKTASGSFKTLESGITATKSASKEVASLASKLEAELRTLERGQGSEKVFRQQALRIVNSAVSSIHDVNKKLGDPTNTEQNLEQLRREFDDKNDQIIALFESAAVGLSARGLAHELRTHLSEIRKHVSAIDTASSKQLQGVKPHIRAIRSSCSAIASAASLIDPMLPRSRAIKEKIDLRDFFEEYTKSRKAAYEGAGIKVQISGDSKTVRMNRSRLLQVVDNLMRNSAYWLRRGERTGQTNREKIIFVGLNSSGFTLADTGPGVDPHYEGTLFDLFISAKPDRDSGQGLGLFIITELLRIDGCEIMLLEERNEYNRRYKFAVNLASLIVR